MSSYWRSSVRHCRTPALLIDTYCESVRHAVASTDTTRCCRPSRESHARRSRRERSGPRSCTQRGHGRRGPSGGLRLCDRVRRCRVVRGRSYCGEPHGDAAGTVLATALASSRRRRLGRSRGHAHRDRGRAGRGARCHASPSGSRRRPFVHLRRRCLGRRGGHGRQRRRQPGVLGRPDDERASDRRRLVGAGAGGRGDDDRVRLRCRHPTRTSSLAGSGRMHRKAPIGCTRSGHANRGG